MVEDVQHTRAIVGGPQAGLSEQERDERLRLLLEVARLRNALRSKAEEYEQLSLVNAQLHQMIEQQNEVCEFVLREVCRMDLTTQVDVPSLQALCIARTEERDQRTVERDHLLQQCQIMYARIQKQAAEVECPVCMQPMRSAYTLYECGHSLCTACFTEIQQGASPHKPLCPTCRAVVIVTPCRNFSLEQLAEAAQM
ncbi:hypothetical protein PENSPDRAFT_691190 [Peniophora sp. CONT]|nr:hypothetical protein PENSPDRAFT_691190 [Peniophora sp. CONT]